MPSKKLPRLLAATLLVIFLSSTALAASVQHHPFSQLFEPDQPLNFGGQDAVNISEVETARIVPNSSDIKFRDSGDVNTLVWDNSEGEWKVVNSDLSIADGNFTVDPENADLHVRTDTGKVGIGTDDPQAGLEVVNGSGTFALNDPNASNLMWKLDAWSTGESLRIRRVSEADGSPLSDGDKLIIHNSSDIEIPNGNLNVSGGDINLSNNSLVAVGGTECAAGEALLGDGSCGVAADPQNLSQVLTQGNEANQSINMSGNDLDLYGGNITDNSQGNVTVGKSLKIYGNIWLQGDGSDSGEPLGAQNLSDVLSRGNSAGDYDINLNGNALRDIGAVYDDSGTQCGSDEFLNGQGSCTTDSFAADTDNQDLQDVLSQGNSAGSYDINLTGQEIIDSSGAITLGGGDVDIPNGDIDLRNRGTLSLYDSSDNLGGDILSSTTALLIDAQGDNDIELRDSDNNEIIVAKDNNNVEVPNGNLNVTNNNITATEGGTETCIGDQC